jgi:small-conductance mechanosensitive channel
MKIKAGQGLLYCAGAGLALLVTWGAVRHPQAHSLFDTLGGDAKWFLLWPLFTVGNVPVTALFLIKCTIFLVALSFLSRTVQRFMSNNVLPHTSVDRGRQYAIARACRYVLAECCGQLCGRPGDPLGRPG